MHAIKRSSGILCGSKIEPVLSDHDRDSFLTPHDTKHNALRNVTRTQVPPAEPFLSSPPASQNLLGNSNERETPWLDDSAIGKRLDPAHCFLVLCEGSGCLFEPASWAEPEFPCPTCTSLTIHSPKIILERVTGSCMC